MCWSLCVERFSDEELREIMDICGCLNHKTTKIVNYSNITSKISKFYHLIVSRKKIEIPKDVQSYLRSVMDQVTPIEPQKVTPGQKSQQIAIQVHSPRAKGP
jgi:hypothetical protein